ncbi:MAG TPA: CvpA family protein [Campylobacterales bacterium]|nr:CvpA family protein [Campylobacterales bacterium]
MEFMGFHMVDIGIVALIAFLAIKGLVNGFTKELLNFLSIVGGVLLAARYNTDIVALLNAQNLIPHISDSFAKPVGFILIILAVFIILGLISSVISSLSSGTTGILSRIAGYVLSAARYVFIFSLIIFGVSQSDFFEKSATTFEKETQLFKPMRDIGRQILNIDINQTSTEANETVETNMSKEESNSTIESNINRQKPSSIEVAESNSSTNE